MHRRRVRFALAILAALLAGVACTQRALDGAAHSRSRRRSRRVATVAVRGALVEDPDGGPYWARVLVRVAGFDGGAPVGRTVLLSRPW